MSKDARAWREEAAAATAGGKHKRALAAYLELERIETRDAQWAKRAAEAYRKLGRDSDAIAAYSRSADRYAQNGFLVQAIAVYKLILQIDGQHGETHRRLAAMTDQVGAAPTRVGEMAENNVNLHDDSRVALLRQPRVTHNQFDGSGGFSLPSEEMYLEDFAQPAPPPPSYSALNARTMPMPLPMQTPAPAPAPQAQRPLTTAQHSAQYAHTQQLPREVRLPAEPPRAPPAPQLPPPIAISRTRSAPISLGPGLALDSVKMSEAVPEARVHSQAGIYMIPIDDEDLIPGAELDAAMEAHVELEHDEELELAPEPEPELPEAIDISLDTVPPKKRPSEVSMEMSPADIIHLPHTSVEESTELELEDLEEIPLAAPIMIAAQSLKALQATPLFAGLPSAALEALVSRLSIVTLEPGEVLFHEGDPGDSLYVVVEGEVVMESAGPPRTEMARFGPDSYIGEVALVTDQPRAATVSAVESAQLLQIDRVTLAAVLAEHGDLLRAILRFVRDRLVDRWTRTSPLFRPFDDAARADLAGRFKFLEIEGGTTVLAAGKKPDGLYIVLAGIFAVQRSNGSQIAALGPGELIGETALLSGGAFKSNVVAQGRSLALCLPASQFREIIMTHPHVLEYIGEKAEHARKLQIV